MKSDLLFPLGLLCMCYPPNFAVLQQDKVTFGQWLNIIVSHSTVYKNNKETDIMTTGLNF